MGESPLPLQQVSGVVGRGREVGATSFRRSGRLPTALRARHEGGPGLPRGRAEWWGVEQRFWTLLASVADSRCEECVEERVVARFAL